MPGLTEFKLLAIYEPYQLHRYAMGWNKQSTYGVDEWEKREPGSLAGVLKAYDYAISIIRENRRIDIDDLINMHAFCMMRLRDSIYNFRTAHVGFKIGRGNSSEAGLRELSKKQQISKNLYRSANVASCKGVGLLIGNEEQVFEQLLALRADRGFYLQGYQGELTEQEAIKITATNASTKLKEKYRAAIRQKVDEILNTFYLKLEAVDIDSADEKLKVIISVTQELEQLHPFFDGNCRTFCIVLLNTLLMQYDFIPTLIDDPNKFDGYSIDELVVLVQEGMIRTKELCNYVVAHQTTPTFFSSIVHASSNLGDPIDNNSISTKESISGEMIYDWIEVAPAQRSILADFASSLISNLTTEPENTTRHKSSL